MNSPRTLPALLTSLMLLTSGSACAGLIGASVDLTASNGFSNGDVICKSGTASGKTVDAALELSSSDWGGGCNGAFNANVSDNQVVLSSFEQGNYSYANLHLHFTSGAAITSVTFGGYSGLFSDAPLDFMPVITFSASDIDVLWNTTSDSINFYFGNGEATFNVTTAAASVPEPTSVALIGLALAGMAGARRVARRV